MVQQMSRTITVKRRRATYSVDRNTVAENIEVWVAFWRANIHRFISDYLGLPYLADFQPVLLYFMDSRPYFISAMSRGLAYIYFRSLIWKHIRQTGQNRWKSFADNTEITF